MTLNRDVECRKAREHDVVVGVVGFRTSVMFDSCEKSFVSVMLFALRGYVYLLGSATYVVC